MAQNPKKFEVPVVVNGDVTTSGVLKVTQASANEGGQIELAVPSSGTSISTNVTIDVYQNKLRFFEAGGTNRGYYVDITGGASAAGTSLTGGSTGAMNYAQTQGTKQSAISTAGTTIVSVSITTNGYPVHVMVTGDVENNSAGGWVVLQLYRGTTAIGKAVHAESSAGSENVPYALQVVDTPAAGTYTYALKLNNSAGGTFNFGETDGPVISAVELSGPKGDTGSAGANGTSPNAFTTIATTSGTSPVADSTSDTLTLSAGASSGITVTGDATTDTVTIGTNAASANGASTLVIRDASGNFAGGTITATTFSGSGASLTNIPAANVTGALSGLTGVSSTTLTSTVITGTAPLTVASTTQVNNLNANYLNGYTAASGNSASTVVARDASGNFSAGTITANLTGTASYATTINAISQVTGLQTALDDKMSETPTILAGSEDLNTKTTPGLYHQNANADAATGTNYPAAQAGMLTVAVGEGFYYQTYQTYGGTGTNRYFFRGYYNTTWSAWEEVVGTGDTGTVTNTMLAGSIATNKLVSNAITIGSTSVILGNTSTTLAGMSSITFAGSTSGTITVQANATAGTTTLTLPATTGTLMSTAVPGTLTGSMTLRAGTASAGTAPLYLQSGTNLTTPVAGAVEYDGTAFYTTPNATTGRAVDVASYYYVSDGVYNVPFDLTTTAKPIFGSATTGLTLLAGTTYEFELTVFASITWGGVNTPSFSHSFLTTTVSGTPTTTIYQHMQYGSNTTSLPTATTLSSIRNANNAAIVIMASISTGSRHSTYTSRGIIRVTGTGSVEVAPAVSSSTTTADYTFAAQAGSYIKLTPIGNGTVAAVGAWA